MQEKIRTMKNIHVLPTDKPSRLFEDDLQLYYSKDKNIIGSIISNQHIYITSDEEIKEGDWYISILENEVYKATKETQNIMSVANLIGTTTYKNTHFKIILTTDQYLIKDGVQAIDDEFLEWFVKNPSCEEVEVIYIDCENCIKLQGQESSPDCCHNYQYKIIIPKEEPKQETLEEAAKNIFKGEYICNGIDIVPAWREGFVTGAKWQAERMYSEEDMKEAFIEGYKQRAEKSDLIFDNASRMYAIHLFEQFKNK